MTTIKIKKDHERTSSYFTEDNEDVEIRMNEPKSPIIPSTPMVESTPTTPLNQFPRSQSEAQLTRKNSMPTPKNGIPNNSDPWKHSSSHYNLKSPKKEGRSGRQDRKKLLSSFYGSTESTPVTSPQPGGLRPKTISLTEDDIDTPHFNADRYVKSLLSKNDLNSLIDKEKKLCEGSIPIRV